MITAKILKSDNLKRLYQQKITTSIRVLKLIKSNISRFPGSKLEFFRNFFVGLRFQNFFRKFQIFLRNGNLKKVEHEKSADHNKMYVIQTRGFSPKKTHVWWKFMSNKNFISLFVVSPKIHKIQVSSFQKKFSSHKMFNFDKK